MFQTVLAAIKPAQAHSYVTEFALSLAAEWRMAVEACCIIDLERLAPREAAPIGGGSFKREADEHRIAQARQDASEILARLATAAQQRGIACATQVLEGETVATLSQAMRSCDALLCGHTAGGDASDTSLLYSILKQASRPAIVVPQAEFTGRAVLIAYDGSVQATRALTSFANSGLAEGHALHVVSFDNDENIAQSRAAEAQLFLQRHGLSCETHAGKIAKNLSESILSEASRLSAGLIVMGAFGRGAVMEFFLGSITRSMLETLPMPLFLDH